VYVYCVGGGRKILLNQSINQLCNVIINCLGSDMKYSAVQSLSFSVFAWS